MAFWSLLPQGSGSKAKGGSHRRVTSVETLHELECRACPLNEIRGLRHPKMEATGASRPLVYMLGEAPGAEEDERGIQFIGVSGQVIRNLVSPKLRKKLRWNNCVRTRPPKNRNPTRTEIECFPGDTIVLPVGSLRKIYRRWYSGSLVKITTVSGRVLSGSPKHPVFTGEGLRALGSLKDGDYLISTADRDLGSPGDPNEDYKPAKISELFGALSLSRKVERILGERTNFHGDGRNGYVDIVHVDCLLGEDGDTLDRQEPNELMLTSPGSNFCALVVYRSLSEHFVGKSEAAGTSISFRSLVGCVFSVPGSVGFVNGSNLNFALEKPASHDIARDAEPGCNLTTSEATPVEFDKVCNVECYPFHGYLYNLETSTGNYTANGIKVKNCCRPSIVRDIERSKPKAIFAFGGVALSWATGEEGIYKWRGRRVPLRVGSHTCWLFPMLHPAGFIRLRKRGRRGGQPLKSEAEKTFARDLKRAFREVRSLPDAQISSPYRNSDVIPSPTGGGRVAPDPDDPRKTFDGIDYVTGSEGEKDLRRVRQWLLKMAASPTAALDFETASEESTQERQTRPYGKGSRILSVAVASPSRSLAFPLHHSEAKWTPKQLARVEKLVHEFLVTAKGVKIAHNLAFELEWACYFYDLDLVYAGIWGDTMAQAYVLNERKGMLSLDSLTIQHFGFSLKDLVRLNIAGLDSEPLPLVLAYNALDALYANKLFHHQRSLLKSDGLLDVYKMHVKPIPATVIKRLFGNTIDFDRVLAFDEKYSAELDRLKLWISGSKSAKKFKDHTGAEFNPSSSSDVITMFKEVLNRREGWREERGNKKYSVDDEVLGKIGSVFARKIQAWRAVTGNKAKYVDPLHPETGKCIFPDKRTHATLNLFFTDTGRTSCSFPNEQYWPKRDEKYRDLRSVFVADDDCYMVAVDQGQIEARVIEMAACDQQYGEYLWARHDIHMDWTERLAYAYPRRVGGKKFLKDKESMARFRYDVKNQWTFPLFFGAVAPSVSGYLGMPLSVIGPLVDDFWEEFSGIKEWQEELETFYDRYGYVSCLTGRRRRAPISINELINSPIQGTASDITVDAFSRLSRAAWEMEMWQFQARLEVHDELVFQIPKKTFDRDVEFICDYLLDCDHFDFINVPLCVEVSSGPNWFEQKSVMTLFSDDFGKIDRATCGF